MAIMNDEDTFLRTFLNSKEYQIVKNPKSQRSTKLILREIAKNRHLIYNKNNSSAFKIRVSRKLQEQFK